MSLLRSAIAVVAVLTCSTAFGQRPTLGIGVEVGVPAGDLNTTQKIGIGGSANFAYPVGGGTALTLSAGYISYSGDEFTVGNTTVKGDALNFIPIKAGVRYQFVPNGFYLEPN